MKRSLLTLLPAICLLGSGCSSEDDDDHGGYENVILEGAVTDETMTGLGNALEAGEPAASTSKAPTLDAPAEGASLPADTAPTFTWHLGATPARSVPTGTEPAHGDPYSGYGTYLEFAAGSEAPLIQVLTSELSWTPSAEVWDELAAAGQPITLTLVGAEFEQDRVIQEGGPYAGSSIQFEVSP